MLDVQRISCVKICLLESINGPCISYLLLIFLIYVTPDRKSDKDNIPYGITIAHDDNFLFSFKKSRNYIFFLGIGILFFFLKKKQ